MTSIQIDLKDGLSSSVAIKGPCIVATTANITLSGEQTIDGVAVVTDDRVLVKDQTTGSENGIWICDTGAWRRSKDFNKTKDVKSGTLVNVTSGTVGHGQWQVSTADPITIGTTNLSFIRSVETSAGLPIPPVANTFLQRNAGNTAYVAKTVAETRDALDAVVYVADRAALAALDTTKDKAAVIWNEGLRNGRLAFNSSNLSSQVTADTNQYTYVAPASAPTGASGAWVYDSGLFVGQFPTPAIRSERAKMQDRCDLRDWNGLDLTGVNDNATLVQAAVNATAAAGVKLNVPAGKITLGSKITVPQFANIEGTGQPATGFSGAINTQSTFFHLAHLDVGFQLLGSNDGPRRVAGFGTYRDQTAPGVGWTPIASAADVQFQGVYDAIAEDLFFYNANIAIEATGRLTGGGMGNGRLTLRGLRGQPLTWGTHLTHIYDVVYLDDIHWWPWWTMDANVLAYMKANATATLLGRVDWPLIGRLFSWGMRSGLYLQNQASVGFDGGLPAGVTTHLHADTISVDNCQRGLVVDAGASGVSLSIDRLTCTNTVYAADPMLTVAGNNARITIADLYGANTDANLLTITGGGNDVKIGRSRSSGIDHDANGTPEFNVAAGNTLTLATKPITSAGTVYAFAGTGRISSPDWINFTPTIASTSGTITTVAAIAAGDCKYKLEGTTCTFDYTVTITTNGTGAGTFTASLPFSSKKISGTLAGKVGAVALTGFAQSGGTARADITKYDGTYPGADGAVLRFGGSFEIA